MAVVPAPVQFFPDSRPVVMFAPPFSGSGMLLDSLRDWCANDPKKRAQFAAILERSKTAILPRLQRRSGGRFNLGARLAGYAYPLPFGGLIFVPQLAQFPHPVYVSGDELTEHPERAVDRLREKVAFLMAARLHQADDRRRRFPDLYPPGSGVVTPPGCRSPRFYRRNESALYDSEPPRDGREEVTAE